MKGLCLLLQKLGHVQKVMEMDKMVHGDSSYASWMCKIKQMDRNEKMKGLKRLVLWSAWRLQHMLLAHIIFAFGRKLFLQILPWLSLLFVKTRSMIFVMVEHLSFSFHYVDIQRPGGIDCVGFRSW